MAFALVPVHGTHRAPASTPAKAPTKRPVEKLSKTFQRPTFLFGKVPHRLLADLQVYGGAAFLNEWGFCRSKKFKEVESVTREFVPVGSGRFAVFLSKNDNDVEISRTVGTPDQGIREIKENLVFIPTRWSGTTPEMEVIESITCKEPLLTAPEASTNLTAK
jgi:hypothetical protein